MEELFDIYFSRSQNGKSYKSEEEYLHTQYSFLDMCIALACFIMVDDGEGEEKEEGLATRKLHIRELPGTLEDAYASVWRNQKSVPEDKLEYARKQLFIAKQHMNERLIYTPYLGKKFKMLALITELNLTDLEAFLLVIGGANSYDEKYERIFADLQGREDLNHPTFQTALFLYSLFEEVDNKEVARLLQKKGTLMECLLDVKKGIEGKPRTFSFAINRRVCSYFYGYEDLDNDIRSFAQYKRKEDELQEIYIRQDLEERILRSIRYHVTENKEKGNVLHVYGTKGNGKKLFLRHAAKEIQKGLIFVDVGKLEIATLKEIETAVSKLQLESILLDSLLCFVDSKNREEPEEEKTEIKFPMALSYLLELLAEKMNFFLWVSQEQSKYLLDFPLHLQCMEQPMLSVGERITLWNKYASGYPLSKETESYGMCKSVYFIRTGNGRSIENSGFYQAGIWKRYHREI